MSANLYWAATYQLLAWWGGLFGLYTSNVWGGYKSTMGRAIIYFSIGMIFQAIGQTTFSVYTTLLGTDIPYPSIADIGYFGSVIWYTLGIWTIAKVSGATFELKRISGIAPAFVLPIAVLFLSYSIFLKDYQFDLTAPLRIFLDFGYPLGEAVYVSVAILALILSREMLGGIMREPLIALMLALMAQYVAEFNFLSQAANSSWVNGGYGDMLYLFSYFLMAFSLSRIYSALASHTAPSSS